MSNSLPDSKTIRDFISDIPQAERLWMNNVVRTWHPAYAAAFRGFDDAMKAQKEYDKRQLDIALFGLSLVGGSVLTRVFADATVKSAAKEVTLSVICNNEMERAFKFAAFIEGDATASFVAGKLFDKGQSVVSGELKKKLEANATNYPSLRKFREQPGSIKSHFEKFVGECAGKLHMMAAAVRDDPATTKEQEAKALTELKAIPFWKNAPGPDALGSTLQQELELAWYMDYVITLDRKVVYNVSSSRGGGNATVKSNTAIKASPTSPKYPQPSSNVKITGGLELGSVRIGGSLSGTRTRIEYGAVPNKIGERIDRVHKTAYGKPFFQLGKTLNIQRNNITNRDTLRRAEATTKRIATRGLEALKSRLKK